jgi:predicted short-subunit dehydrogenase-like oxidoreductase (DUF2520 family)
MMTAATVAAGTFLQILIAGNAAQLERLADGLLHSLLQLVHFLLGVDEPFAHGVAEKGVALGVERGDFAAIQGKALMLAFVERAALLAQALILLLRGGIGHESVHAPADALKLGLLHEGLTELQSLLAHHVLNLGSCLHKLG